MKFSDFHKLFCHFLLPSLLQSKKLQAERKLQIKFQFFLTLVYFNIIKQKKSLHQEMHEMKKTLLVSFISIAFLISCSNPIDQAKQRYLIETNEISKGMNCQNLTKLLGGYRAITYLYLEKKNLAPRLENSFILFSTASEDENKNYFLCERTRIDNIRIRQKVKKHISDYDLIKIYQDPIVMIKQVLRLTSEYTRMNILSRVNLLDYNLTRSGVAKILDEIVMEERILLDEETRKAEKVLKEEIKKERENVPEDEDQKALRKKLLEELSNKN